MEIDLLEIDRQAIFQTFLIESAELLATMEEGLVALETCPANQETLYSVFRLAHTIKGSGSCLGLETLTDFVHIVENVLDAMRKSSVEASSDVITLLLLAVDAMREMIPETLDDAESMSPTHTALLQKLADHLPAPQLGFAIPVNPAPAPEETQGREPEEFAVNREGSRTLRVDMSKLDRMLNLAGEITIATGQLKRLVSGIDDGHRAQLEEAQGEIDLLFTQLRNLVNQVRMVPLGPTFRRYIRTVRDLAAARGKEARLAIEGADVEVDTTIIEHIVDPLTHMIRNAVDHGIEPPSSRIVKGKDPCGLIILSAYHGSGGIVIRLADDGAGLNKKRIEQRAIEMGLISGSEGLTDLEIQRLVFESGFSTAETLTEMSGRGLGMDIVRRNIEAILGSVDIESTEGEGTTLTFRLPLTLAIIDAFGVSVGEETYFIPLGSVQECIELTDVMGGRSNGKSQVVALRGSPLPCLDVREVFDLPQGPPSRQNVVVVRHDDGLAGLIVDGLHGESQVVIKPLGKLFRRLPGVSGSTILEDGKVALILDIPALLRPAAPRLAEARPAG